MAPMNAKTGISTRVAEVINAESSHYPHSLRRPWSSLVRCVPQTMVGHGVTHGRQGHEGVKYKEPGRLLVVGLFTHRTLCFCSTRQFDLQSSWRSLPKYTSSSWVCLHPLVRCSTVMISVSLPRSLPPRLSRASSMSPATMRLARLCLSSQVVHSLEPPSLVLLVTGSVDD